jgi:hypothetical protein
MGHPFRARMTWPSSTIHFFLHHILYKGMLVNDCPEGLNEKINNARGKGKFRASSREIERNNYNQPVVNERK